jgi:hypothetical protein
VPNKRHSHAVDQRHTVNSENSQLPQFCGCQVSEAAIRKRW